MSWSGTVTCSHCYNRGHNKRKCPTLTESILSDYQMWATSVKKHIAEGNKVQAEYHQGRAEHFRTMYMKRTKIDPATGEKVKNKVAKAERMKNMTCGYCGVTGHTRRTCQNVKNDYAIYAERTRQVREQWYEQFKALGVGPGTMVIAKRNGFNPKTDEYGPITVTGLITGIEWAIVDAHREGSPLKITTNAQLRGESYTRNNIGDMSLGALDPESQYAHSKLTVSPTTTEVPSTASTSKLILMVGAA